MHTWAGLLVFVHLAIYGIVGLAALAGAGLRSPIPLVRTFDRDFLVAPQQSDIEIAGEVCRTLGLTLAMPVNRFAIQHDDAHRLVLDLWHANGHHRVTVFEQEHRLHVEEFRVGAGRYLAVLHMTTAAFRSDDWRMTAWSWWNEFALWCMAWMILSGTWIWGRRGPATWMGQRVHRWAGLLMAAPLSVYVASAIRLAHRTWWPVAKPHSGWNGALMDLHRATTPFLMAAILALASLGLFLAGASGLWLSLRNPRERTMNLVVVSVSATVALFLVFSMRL